MVFPRTLRLRTTLRSWAIVAAPPALAVAGAMVVAPPALNAVASSPPTMVLEVRAAGGFAPQFTDFRAVPTVLITSDRRSFTPAPVPAVFPGPMLQPVNVTTLSRAAVSRIDRLARAANLDKRGVDWGVPPTADVPELVVSYRGRVTRIASFGVGEERLTTRQRAARKKVADLLASLPSDAPSTAFAPTAVVVAARLSDPALISPDLPKPQTVDWPVDAEPITAPSGCVVVRAPAAVKLLSSARANGLFRSAGKTWELYARPMLPGDPGCA